MFVDLMMYWQDAVGIVREAGWDGWMRFIAEKFPNHDLYSASKDWFAHGPEYIAKLKGGNGDVLVGWKK